MNKTILLVDDDASVRQTLGRAINAEDYAVILAKTGREAISALITRFPDLVLLDLNLPEKNGWEAFHFMRQLNPELPIIIITGTPNQFTQALRMGATGLMEKPLDLPILFRAIKNGLEESERCVRAPDASGASPRPRRRHACELLAAEAIGPSSLDRFLRNLPLP